MLGKKKDLLQTLVCCLCMIEGMAKKVYQLLGAKLVIPTLSSLFQQSMVIANPSWKMLGKQINLKLNDKN